MFKSKDLRDKSGLQAMNAGVPSFSLSSFPGVKRVALDSPWSAKGTPLFSPVMDESFEIPWSSSSMEHNGIMYSLDLR